MWQVCVFLREAIYCAAEKKQVRLFGATQAFWGLGGCYTTAGKIAVRELYIKIQIKTCAIFQAVRYGYAGLFVFHASNSILICTLKQVHFSHYLWYV